MDPSKPKVFIQIDPTSEQQENTKALRKTSRSVLQKVGDKENLVEPVYVEPTTKKTAESDVLHTPIHAKRKVPSKSTSLSQTSPSLNPATVDLLSENVDENFWEKKAEIRRVDLEVSLTENQELYERIATLEEEFNLSESLIVEAENIVEILKDILKEDEGNHNDTESSREEADETNQNNNDQESSV